MACSQSGFWKNPGLAVSTLQELRCIRDEIDSLNALGNTIAELKELSELEPSNFLGVFQICKEALTEAEEKTIMDGPMDRRNAIVCLTAQNQPDGCVGVERLRRMFLQQASVRGYQTQILTVSEHEYGLSFAAFSVIGSYSFGWAKKLEIQHANVAVEILPEVHSAELSINEKEVSIAIFRMANLNGRGTKITGASINIIHHPTGIMVRCNSEKSSWFARQMRMQILRAKIWTQGTG